MSTTKVKKNTWLPIVIGIALVACVAAVLIIINANSANAVNDVNDDGAAVIETIVDEAPAAEPAPAPEPAPAAPPVNNNGIDPDDPSSFSCC